MQEPLFYKEASTTNLLKKIPLDLHSLFYNALVALLFSGTPAIWHYVKIKQIDVYAILFLLLFLFIVVVLQFYNIQKITLSKSMHNCFHLCRDETVSILNNLKQGSRIDSIGKLSETLCNTTKDFFKAVKRDKGNIGVAIRIAGINETHPEAYATVARSGLNVSRGKNSEPINKDEGVAKYLLDNNASGCAIYKNINEIDSQYYKRTANDNSFHEVVSMIAAPINRGNGMIGILHITSDKKDFFSQDDIEYAKASADFAATILSQKLYEIEQAGNRPSRKRRR